jgi:3alpha(or 20beta)-hydroxysteroid dehydrogenase
VRCNCLCPGGIDQGQAIPKNPMNRLAKPEDLFGPVALLISDASSYMTGSVVTVDGGRTAI